MQNETERKGFTIEFEFSPNEYFSNSLLSKSYELRTGPDEEEPLSYEGPEIVKSTGCEIQWKKGKNVTVKMVKKRQKHKNRGTIRVVTKEVKTDSFFNFFTPPAGRPWEKIFSEKTAILGFSARGRRRGTRGERQHPIDRD